MSHVKIIFYSKVRNINMEVILATSSGSDSLNYHDPLIFVLFCIQNAYLVKMTHGQLITIRIYV